VKRAQLLDRLDAGSRKGNVSAMRTLLAFYDRADAQQLIDDLDGVTGAGAPDYRRVGCDAPETVRAQCQSERALGEQATSRLRAIVAAGGISLNEFRAHASRHRRPPILQSRATLRRATCARQERVRHVDRGGAGAAVRVRADAMPAAPGLVLTKVSTSPGLHYGGSVD
jgi:hypothetical protein